jgi:hypothetical protein
MVRSSLPATRDVRCGYSSSLALAVCVVLKDEHVLRGKLAIVGLLQLALVSKGRRNEIGLISVTNTTIRWGMTDRIKLIDLKTQERYCTVGGL